MLLAKKQFLVNTLGRVKFFLKWLLGPLLSLSFLVFVETTLNPPQHRLVGILIWVVLWWITQPISLSATGLLGVSLAVALGVSDFNNAFGGFSHKVIFLLIGTFFLAEAMKVHRVDRAITYRVLSLNVIQNRPRLALFTILSLAGILSWWFSATATTAMLVPIAMGLFPALKSRIPLAVAYATALGGIAFPLGANPNILCRALVEQQLQIKIGFLEWMKPGLIVSGLSIAGMYLLLFGFKPIVVQKSNLKIEPLTGSQKNTLGALFLLTLLWIGPSLMRPFFGENPLFLQNFEKFFPEAISALLVGTILFCLPWREKRNSAWKPTLTWDQAKLIDWNVILMVGAGLSIGTLIFKTGLAEILAEMAVRLGGNSPSFIIAVGLIFVATLLVTEVTSNTATGEVMLPLAIAMAVKMNQDPVIIAMGVAFIASLGFVIPAATPPVAVALSIPEVKKSESIKFGAIIDFYAFVIIFLVVNLFK